MSSIPPTIDRLRHDIDHGKTGEKVDFPDPAAAPLGTDAEAGGHPPKPAEIALDRAAQAKSVVQPPAISRRIGDLGIPLYVGEVGLVGALVLAIAFFVA